MRTGRPGPFGDRRVVGEVVAAGRVSLLMRRQDRREGEALRRLRGKQPGPRHRASTDPSASARFSVSATGRAGRAPAPAAAAAITRSISAGSTKGRTASWMSTISGEAGASAASARRVESCRVAPPIDHREAVAASRRPRRTAPHRRRGSPRRSGRPARARERRRGCARSPAVRRSCDTAWARPRRAGALAAAGRHDDNADLRRDWLLHGGTHKDEPSRKTSAISPAGPCAAASGLHAAAFLRCTWHGNCLGIRQNSELPGFCA